MHISVEPEIPLARMLGSFTPDVRIVQLAKTELAALERAAKILHALRAVWGDDDNHVMDTDVALAAYTMDDIVEAGGRLEVGYVNAND